MQTAFKVTVAFNCAAICILLYAFSKDSERMQSQASSQVTGAAISFPAPVPNRSHQPISKVLENQIAPSSHSERMPTDDQVMMQELHIGTMPTESSK
ncbi:hypothetical protein ACO0LB_16880 [Undibacterium sp. SXout7W]|uniref:hypothetical protein n=1 Tax=Undibacterium sp. SXout7W TaxID=3413049 RepID=UPI003BF233C3